MSIKILCSSLTVLEANRWIETHLEEARLKSSAYKEEGFSPMWRGHPSGERRWEAEKKGPGGEAKALHGSLFIHYHSVALDKSQPWGG